MLGEGDVAMKPGICPSIFLRGHLLVVPSTVLVTSPLSALMRMMVEVVPWMTLFTGRFTSPEDPVGAVVAGAWVGEDVEAIGAFDGLLVGTSVGLNVGPAEGLPVGPAVTGEIVGESVGDLLGPTVGVFVGL